MRFTQAMAKRGDRIQHRTRVGGGPSPRRTHWARWSLAKHWQPGTPAHTNIARKKRGGRPIWTPLGAKPVAAQARPNLLRKFDVRKLFVAIWLELVDDHRQALGHRVGASCDRGGTSLRFVLFFC